MTLAEVAQRLGRDDGGLSRAVCHYERVMEEDDKEKRFVKRIADSLMP